MRKLLCILFAAAILAAPLAADAATYKVTAKPVPGTLGAKNATFKVTWPTTVQNDSVYVFIPNRDAYNPHSQASGVFTLSLGYCMDIGANGGGAAADSVSVTLWQASSANSGLNSFHGTAINAAALQSYTLTASIPCISKSAIALTHWSPAAPYLVMACKVKGNTTLTSRTMFISFPKIGAYSTQ